MGAMMVAVLAGLGVLSSLFWIAQLVEAIRFRFRAVWLVEVPAEHRVGEWPAVAVIFAARNEAAMVERAGPDRGLSTRSRRLPSSV